MNYDNHLLDLYNNLKSLSKTSFSAFMTNADDSFVELRQSFRSLNQMFVDSRWRDSVSVLVESNFNDVDLMISKCADYTQNTILPVSEQSELLAERLRRYYYLVNQNASIGEIETCAKECYETINNINGLLGNNVTTTETATIEEPVYISTNATVEPVSYESTSTAVETSTEEVSTTQTQQKTGLILENDVRYFIKDDGTKASNEWVQTGDELHYAKEDGTLASNEWLKLGDKWYHFNSYAQMNKDAVFNIDGKDYLLQADGSMASNGWVKSSSGNWYYANADGSLEKNKWIQDGNDSYYLNGFGALETSTVIYEDANGNRISKQNAKDAVNMYCVDENGKWVKNGWCKETTDTWDYWHYVKDGKVVKNDWVVEGDSKYYIFGDGTMAANRDAVIGGRTYHFDKSGKMVTNQTIYDSLNDTYMYFGSDGAFSHFVKGDVK